MLSVNHNSLVVNFAIEIKTKFCIVYILKIRALLSFRLPVLFPPQLNWWIWEKHQVLINFIWNWNIKTASHSMGLKQFFSGISWKIYITLTVITGRIYLFLSKKVQVIFITLMSPHFPSSFAIVKCHSMGAELATSCPFSFK